MQTQRENNLNTTTTQQAHSADKPGFEFTTLQQFQSGQISRQEAAILLECSERTVTRKLKKIKTKGAAGLVHGNKSRTPINKKSEGLKEKYLSRYLKQYQDLNFFHALEMLHKEFEASDRVSYTTFKNWCLEAGIEKTRRRRSKKRPAEKAKISQKWSQPKIYPDMFLTPQEPIQNAS